MKFIPSCVISFIFLTNTAYSQEISVSFSESLKEDFRNDYGISEMEALKNALVQSVKDTASDASLDIPQIELIIEDAVPNHPTRRQLAKKPGLDRFRSVSRGGAKISGIALDESGAEISSVTYDHYALDLKDAQRGATWAHAKRAFDRFSTRLIKNSRPN